MREGGRRLFLLFFLRGAILSKRRSPGRSCSPTLANACRRKLRHGLALRRTNRNGPRGGRSPDRGSERDNDEREFVVCPVQSPRIPRARRLVWTATPATADTRRPLSSTLFTQLFCAKCNPVRFCGCAYLAVARANWSPKCKNSPFICDLT